MKNTNKLFIASSSILIPHLVTLVLAAIITLAIFIWAYYNVAEAKDYGNGNRVGPYYMTQIDRVVDGDTFNGWAATFIYQTTYMSVRIRAIDTPERRGSAPCEKILANRATARLYNLLENATAVTIDDLDYDSFGRVVAFVYADGVNVGAKLIEEGLARPYVKGQHGGWCMTG